MLGTKLEIDRMEAFWAEGDPANCSFNKNLVFNYGSLTTMSGCSNFTLNGNFVNNTEYEEYLGKVINIQTSERIQFRNNIFTDNHK
jgi:hypothetical protein